MVVWLFLQSGLILKILQEEKAAGIMPEEGYYVLGWPQPRGKVAILCRSRGSNPGPACCWTKREAIQLRTKLANDKRGDKNPNARRIIRQLLVYKCFLKQPLPWRPGDLWAYVEADFLEAVESNKQL